MKKLVLPVAIALVLILLPVIVLRLSGAGVSQLPPSVVVERRDFIEAVETRGTLAPVREEPITAQTWGVIAGMWPDGEPVKAGEVVLEIDDTRDRERLEKDQFELEMAKADLAQAETRAAQQVKNQQREVRKAVTALEAARLQLQEIKTGADPDDLASAEQTYSSSERILQLRREEFDIASELAEARAVSPDELEKRRTAVKRAEIQAEKARLSLEKIRKAPDEADILAAQLEVKTAELNLESARSRLESTIRTTQADIENRRNHVRHREIDIQRRRKRLEENISTAPIDGVVIHAPGRWGTPWQPGRFVWKGFKVLSIPDMKRMKVQANVPENLVPRVAAQAAALIEIASLPGRTFHGHVTSISKVAKDEFEDLDSYTKDKLGRADRQVFPVEVEIDEEDEALRSGLSASVRIISNTVRDALLVPIACIRVNDGEASVSVLQGRSTERMPVRLGPSDQTFIVVEEGLKEGDRVVLAPESSLPGRNFLEELAEKDSPHRRRPSSEEKSGEPAGKPVVRTGKTPGETSGETDGQETTEPSSGHPADGDDGTQTEQEEAPEQQKSRRRPRGNRRRPPPDQQHPDSPSPPEEADAG